MNLVKKKSDTFDKNSKLHKYYLASINFIKNISQYQPDWLLYDLPLF